MEAAIAAESEDCRRRVEAAYGRIAEAETRRQETGEGCTWCSTGGGHSAG